MLCPRVWGTWPPRPVRRWSLGPPLFSKLGELSEQQENIWVRRDLPGHGVTHLHFREGRER